MSLGFSDKRIAKHVEGEIAGGLRHPFRVEVTTGRPMQIEREQAQETLHLARVKLRRNTGGKPDGFIPTAGAANRGWYTFLGAVDHFALGVDDGLLLVVGTKNEEPSRGEFDANDFEAVANCDHRRGDQASIGEQAELVLR